MNAKIEFTLWHRTGRGKPWQPIATAPTEAELTATLVKLPTGEVVTLPAGRHPDRRRRRR